MMALGLAWLSKNRQWRWRPALAVGAALLILTALVMVQVQIVAGASQPSRPWLVEATNIIGVYPFVDLFGMPRLYLATLVALTVFVTLSILMRRTVGGSLALLVLLFGAGALYCERVNLQPARKATADRLSFVPELQRLGPPAALDYDFAFRSYPVFYGAQFLLPDTVFRRFHSRRGEEPTSEVVLSGKGWRQARPLDARLVVAAAAGDTAIWVLPGELRERLPSPSFFGVNLGVEPGIGIEEWGFYPPEEDRSCPGSVDGSLRPDLETSVRPGSSSAPQSCGNPGAPPSSCDVLLKLGRAEVSEGRMPAPAVVETLDVVHDFSSGLLPGVEDFSCDQLLLQGREEALDRSIVVAVSTSGYYPFAPSSQVQASVALANLRARFPALLQGSTAPGCQRVAANSVFPPWSGDDETCDNCPSLSITPSRTLGSLSSSRAALRTLPARLRGALPERARLPAPLCRASGPPLSHSHPSPPRCRSNRTTTSSPDALG